MDNPPNFLGLDNDLTAEDAPVDALAEALITGAEQWLWAYDGDHLGLPFYVTGTAAEPTGPKMASLEWARLLCVPVRVIPGLSKIQVDLSCYISSEENPDEAGVEYWIELIGIGEQRGALAAHTTSGIQLEQLELELAAPLQFDGVLEVAVWFRSQVETTETATGLTIAAVDVVRGAITPASIPAGKAAGLYVLQALDADGGVLFGFDLYDSETSSGTDFISASNLRALAELSARLMALGWIILAGAELRLIYEAS